ncbi:hypothetical protein GGTG_08109 [Gaeumannomyces tritici R3-111a-1]|uniref:Erythromycin biosynthesis protein CIII-like C-terminal domain-containing protein n=1 Tax=Gaeumannomyces tritici (strain R3-111a-1) TaxID=644352 RepID=J3P3M2_GAET3|nr:hypothetical protein GGTG_08109 [Gaeumannomyces tritici R3-111a-1]EJT74266.1 hypothetical protein GGTG_08109 [Gaeumannomyces tritici R3-111a-1]
MEPTDRPDKKVLFLTNAERGQSTVVLATSHALLTARGEDVEVHIASFADLAADVRKASDDALAAATSAALPIVFHVVRGASMAQSWQGVMASGGVGHNLTQMPRRWWDTPAKLRPIFRVMQPWDPESFLEIYQSLLDIIRDVGADLVVIDNVFPPALTACRFLGVRMMVLSPNTIKDFALQFQPGAAALWKFPCVGTAFPYPVPLHLIPLNIFLVLVIVYMAITDPHTKALAAAVEKHTQGARYTSLMNLGATKRLNFKVLVSNLPEIDFPLSFIPSHLVPCGPIIRPARPCAEASPDLATWIARGPTIYINLGTHVRYFGPQEPLRLAGALRMVLDRADSDQERKLGGLQVLWKLVKLKGVDGKFDFPLDEPGCDMHNVLGRYMDAGRVKIVEWVEPEPIAVLQEPNIVLAVHHGGANSFLEAVSAGVPHVVLGVWMDTYDFANRAEYLGIGIWGNKRSKPGCRPEELGPALVDVLMGPRSAQMKLKAAELARLCASNGGGREMAARTILDEIATLREVGEDKAEKKEHAD